MTDFVAEEDKVFIDSPPPVYHPQISMLCFFFLLFLCVASSFCMLLIIPFLIFFKIYFFAKSHSMLLQRKINRDCTWWFLFKAVCKKNSKDRKKEVVLAPFYRHCAAENSSCAHVWVVKIFFSTVFSNMHVLCEVEHDNCPQSTFVLFLGSVKLLGK